MTLLPTVVGGSLQKQDHTQACLHTSHMEKGYLKSREIRTMHGGKAVLGSHGKSASCEGLSDIAVDSNVGLLEGKTMCHMA